MMAGLLDDLIAGIDARQTDEKKGFQDKGNTGTEEKRMFGDYSSEFEDYAKETAVGSSTETGEKGPGKDNE